MLLSETFLPGIKLQEGDLSVPVQYVDILFQTRKVQIRDIAFFILPVISLICSSPWRKESKAGGVLFIA